MSGPPPTRSPLWKWSVCGLLLCASMLMYMDRQTLPSVATRITREFNLSQEQYGVLEMLFGYAFAAGSCTFGIISDRWSVRWLYPAVVIAWSAMGFLTGLVENYEGLLVCRTLLGFFESGHWPCALKTTQRLLSREQRTMGNSVLQSGASFGAILTPLVMNWMLAGRTEYGLWRQPFLVVGSLGVFWLIVWFALLRQADFESPATTTSGTEISGNESKASESDGSFWQTARRFSVLLVMVSCINTCWQIIRAWLPKFLQEGRGYAESEALYFNSLYYIATDVGCIGAGAASLWLVKRGLTVHGSRAAVFGSCAALATLTTWIGFAPNGWLLFGLLLAVGAGTLGLFPCYYSLTQELSVRHQGKVTGFLATAAWIISSPFQKFFGQMLDDSLAGVLPGPVAGMFRAVLGPIVDQKGAFDLGLALVGWLPLISFVFLALFWNWPAKKGFERDRPQWA